ncbi:uncharacterized protein LOC106065948 isoform X2 [Biomphalaria glabrata]|uniref:Uncharacterized protein LOC106065948 isoform X2 n=1 Tax=Biomphalaria glabrata TaxID=6526 RepID=A0A9W3B6C4_BIOGL|nr:uncharacterized protein LOC106065948 isoform X2 [Biomphalaria glabrata]
MPSTLDSDRPATRVQFMGRTGTGISTLTKPFVKNLSPISPKGENPPPLTSPITPKPRIQGPQLSVVEDDMEDSEDLSLEASKLRSERAAEFEIEHNWLLKDETEKRYKRFERTKKQLTIHLPDEDPMEGINNRLEEINSMVKPKIQLLDFLGNFNKEQKERVLNMSRMDSMTMKQERRKLWKSTDYLRHIFKMVYVVTCAANASRRYFYPEDPEAGPSIMRKQRMLHRRRSPGAVKSNLSFELQDTLMTSPKYRTDEQMKKILWLLKTTKAFQNLFPDEMIVELARVVAYERYDHNRHIAYQGRSPELFYFVITGRIHKLREYKLPSGCLNKLIGVMQKGDMSDADEFEHQRQEHLVASGSVEVLILSKPDYSRLLHTTQGLPVEFLLSIDLFKEFPADVFESNASSITYQYYSHNKIICPDVNKTPWLHVVKSGRVKLVRRQYVLDTGSDLLFQEDKDEPGLGRTFSHARAMLGNLDSQRRLRNVNLSLSQLMRQRRKPREINTKRVNVLESTEGSFELTPADVGTTDLLVEEPESDTVMKPEREFTLPTIVVNAPDFKASRLMSPEIKLKGPWSKRSQLSARGEMNQTTHFLPDIQSNDFPRAFLTRDKTTFTDVSPVRPLKKRQKKDVQLRKTCVQLDLLKPGDVFNYGSAVQPELTADETTLSLISDGAEVIRISKRFFLRHARNNTMLRVEIMQRSYLSPEETKQVLYTKDSWCQYKESLMKRLLSSLVR